MKQRRWIRLALLSAAVMAALPAVGLAQAPPVPAAESAQQDLLLQEKILVDPATPAPERERAARRLASRGTPEANNVLLAALSDRNRDAQLAAARAVPSCITPAAELSAFIDPLRRMMGRDVDLTIAAAQALSIFKSNPAVLEGLSQYASNINYDMKARMAVIRAIGRLVDKAAAASLIQQFDDTNPLIREAAAGALADMTGLSQLGTDLQRWRNWWSDNQGKNDAEWARDLLRVASAQKSELDQRLAQFRDDAYVLLSNTYAAIRDRTSAEKENADRAKFLIQLLRAPSEDMRANAVKLIFEDITQFSGRIPTPQVGEALREMVGDNSPLVRKQVAETLGAVNDRLAVDALIAQLAQEPDPDVQAPILRALGRARDPRAVPAVLASLASESFTISKVAAEALRDIAPALLNFNDPQGQITPALVSQRLLQRFNAVNNLPPAVRPTTSDLRQAILQAMVAMQNPAFADIFRGLITPQQDSNPGIRGTALEGLRRLARPETADAIVDALRGDPVASVRQRAAQALRTTGNASHAAIIKNLLQTERDEDVRKAMWTALLGDKWDEGEAGAPGLLDKMDTRGLQTWEAFFPEDDQAHRSQRLSILSKLVSKRDAESDGSPRAAQASAGTHQNRGATLLLLNRPADALPDFKAALAYWEKNNKPVTYSRLIDSNFAALVRSGNIADAVQFVGDQISRDRTITDFVSTALRRELDLMEKARKYDAALDLIRRCQQDARLKDALGPTLDVFEKKFNNLRNIGGWYWVRQVDLLDELPTTMLS